MLGPWDDDFDVEDYDIEGFYEDNKREFRDIDDAADAFEDEDDEWEDY